MIELTSATGSLQLGHLIDGPARRHSVAAGSGPGQNDGRARGSVKLNVPRVGSNDAAIDAASGLRIAGAGDLQVNAFRSYDSAPLASAADAWPSSAGDQPAVAGCGGGPGQPPMDERCAGQQDCSSALPPWAATAFAPACRSWRSSSDNPRGDLVVAGDIDLSGYRYGPQSNRTDPARRGFGESAALVLRAEGDINVYGSINDGFAPPPANPDEDGWVLLEGRSSGTPNTAFGGDLIVPGEGAVAARHRVPRRCHAELCTSLRRHDPAGRNRAAGRNAAVGTAAAAGRHRAGAAVTTAGGEVIAAGTVLAQALSLQAGAPGRRLPAAHAGAGRCTGVAGRRRAADGDEAVGRAGPACRCDHPVDDRWSWPAMRR